MKSEEIKEALPIVFSAVLCVAAVLIDIEFIKIILFLAAYLAVGGKVLLKALKNILKGKVFNEKFLMSIATLGAIAIGEFAEAVAVMIFYQIGELFEDIATEKSRKSITDLMDIRPDTAVVLRKGEELTVSPEEVLVGEIILVKSGEKIPLDGKIVKGKTTLDTSSLTGESLPRTAEIGDTVVSGSINLSGIIEVEVTNLFSESTVSKILELVENASEKKARREAFISRFAKYYTPAVVFSALALALLPPIFVGNYTRWIYSALSFLVVSCPCALVVSVPLSFFGGIGAASKRGILIKGSVYLEELSKITTIAFDKTGTLTKASFAITKVICNNISEEKLLSIASALESGSNHPIAKCIAKAAQSDLKAEEVTEISGMGLEALIEGEKYYAGNSSLMKKAGITGFQDEISATAVHIARENEYLGCILIEDEIKPDTKDALEELKTLGIDNTVMLTGDRKEVALNIAERLDIDFVRAELLPHEKAEAVKSIMDSGNRVVFAGDGINDAPVLATADIGISMGALGSDAAITASDIVIMDDKLSRIAEAIQISRKTLKIATQNIVFAISVKILILILSALGIANMWLAVFGDVGVTVIAVLNAMRTLKLK